MWLDSATAYPAPPCSMSSFFKYAEQSPFRVVVQLLSLFCSPDQSVVACLQYSFVICLDLVFNREATDGDDNGPLMERINSRHGTHIVDYAEQIGLGTKSYELIDISEK